MNRTSLAILLLVHVAACAPAPRVDAWKTDPALASSDVWQPEPTPRVREREPLIQTDAWKKQRWSKRLDTYTLGDAVSEMGPPTSSIAVDGRYVAVWESSGPVVVSAVFSTLIASQRVKRLILTFDEAKPHLLRDWKAD